jgi:hypothetical protein
MAELFENVEVNRDPRWPILLRLVGGSLILHLLLLWLVVYVPAFRDALNVASLIASTRIVDKDYQATHIGDDVQLLDLADQKFHYPEGYFALQQSFEAGQSQPGSKFDPFAPKIISLAQPPGKDEPGLSPSPTPTPSPSPLPSPSASSSPPTAVAQETLPNAQGGPSPSPLTADEAQQKLEDTAAENNLDLPTENQLNKKVLKDFAVYANDLKKQGKLDIDKPFEIVIEAEMDQAGKLKNPRFTKKAGDPNLIDLFGRMVAALNDSGFLIYLKPLNKDNPGATVKFTIKQGENEVLASVESEASSTDSARILAKALNAALVFGAGSRAGKDEEVIMRNTNAAPDGKKIVVNFSMPRQSVVDLIKKQLEPGV